MTKFDPKENHKQEAWRSEHVRLTEEIKTLQNGVMDFTRKFSRLDSILSKTTRRITATQELLEHAAFMAEVGALKTKSNEDDTLELIRIAQEKRAQAGLLETVKTWILVNR